MDEDVTISAWRELLTPGPSFSGNLESSDTLASFS